MQRIPAGTRVVAKPAAAIFVAVDVFLIAALVFVAVKIDHLVIYVGFTIPAAMFVLHALFYLTLLTGRVWLPRRRDLE